MIADASQQEKRSDQPAIIGVRLIALELADRALTRWHELIDAHPNERTPDGTGAEALHDFRVAIRTLRSWLRGTADLLPVSSKTQRRLRDSARATSELRDAEVLSAFLQSSTFPSRQTTAAARWWAKQLLEQANDVDRLRKIERDVERGLADVLSVGGVVRCERPISEPWTFPTLAAELAPRIEAQAAVVRHRLEQINGPAASKKQHQARIAAKHLRYLLEPIEDEVPEVRRARKHLKGLQDALGELHDYHVAISVLPRAVDDRAAWEGSERGQEILRAAAEGRPARRSTSLLSGFGGLSHALEAAADDAYRALDKNWLATGAEDLFVAVEAAVTALARRGNRGLEIERKLLLSGAPTAPADKIVSVAEIEQGYLPGERITERIRRTCRGDETRYVRTVKTGTGLVRTEVEERIDAQLFDRLWPLTEGRRVHKRRTVVRDEKQMWELDEFLDRTLYLAEIELEKPDDDATPPIWLVDLVERDVTDDSDFSNARLAK